MNVENKRETGINRGAPSARAVGLLLLAGFFVVFPVWAQYSAEKTRIGICDLQNNLDAYDPEYVRIAQAGNGYTLTALQWADVEPVQGIYDFSGLDRSLQDIQEKGRYAIVKLNGNDKPDWLFDLVPYNETIWDSSVDDTTGILMYWHTNFVNAYTNLLAAYSDYLATNAYRSLISGVRLNFNPIGTEHTGVPQQYRALEQWVVPPGVGQGPEYTVEIAAAYKDLIVDVHVGQIMPHTYVYVRNNIEDSILEKHRALFESGQLGFFHTGASMEQNQVFNQDWRYSRYIEFCLTGQTRGFCEMAGWYQYLDTYPANPFPKVQWNYWRMLSDLHCGVSMSGFHYYTLFRDLFTDPEFDAAWRFADRYYGLHADPDAAPGAWVALRGSGDNYAGDYMFLMEREGNVPTLPLADTYPGINDHSYEVSRVGSTNVRYGAWARALPAGEAMTFHVDADVFAAGEKRIARVVYLDEGSGSWQLEQGGAIELTVTNGNTGAWSEKEILILTDGDVYELVNTGSEDVIFHMLEVKRVEPSTVSAVYTATDDTFVAEAYPTQNKGSLTELRVRDNPDKTILVQFDIPSLTGKVAAVTLRLFSANMDEIATVRTTGSGWTEGAVTWNTRPGFGDIITGNHTQVDAWSEWDVTPAITGTGTCSFAIESDQIGDGIFVSKEGGKAPQLVVECYDSAGCYQVWTDRHGLRGTVAAYGADPDGDKLSNLGEYGLNGNPTNANDKGTFAIQADGSGAILVHAENISDPGLEYQLLDRTNLMSGTVNTNGWDAQTFGPDTGDYSETTNHYFIAGGQQFIQIRIEHQ